MRLACVCVCAQSVLKEELNSGELSGIVFPVSFQVGYLSTMPATFTLNWRVDLATALASLRALSFPWPRTRPYKSIASYSLGHVCIQV